MRKKIKVKKVLMENIMEDLSLIFREKKILSRKRYIIIAVQTRWTI